jgi:iron complex outermembrane receptor protein
MQGTSQNVGLGTGGAAFANLRGLGQNKTLVLLNGRRLANNAIDSSAPDLNMIPFAALERVEVLRDGASALYGTDAIGGVINFITKKDYRGGAVTVGVDSGQHKGGGSHSANVSYGFGDLEKDRFNVFGVLDYQKDNVLRSSQRDFADRSLKTSPTTFPGQYNQGGNVQNPSFPTCGAPHGIPNSAGGTDATCGYLYAKEVDMIPRDERISGLISGTLKLGSESRLNLEYFYSQTKVQTLIAGVPYGALIINPRTAYSPGNGITPRPTAFTLNPAYMPANPPAGALPGFVKLRMRDELSGGRQEGTNNKQQRLVASLDGVVGGWDYNVGAAYNENKLTDSLIGG